jgi:hypothetical protein
MVRYKPIYTGLKLLPMETGASRSRSKTDRPTSWIMRTTTKMAMHNPPHSGEFIIQVYLDPNNLSGRELAGKLGVAASTLNRILTGLRSLSDIDRSTTANDPHPPASFSARKNPQFIGPHILAEATDVLRAA